MFFVSSYSCKRSPPRSGCMHSRLEADDRTSVHRVAILKGSIFGPELAIFTKFSSSRSLSSPLDENARRCTHKMMSLITSTLASLGISRPLQTSVPRTSLFSVGMRASVSMGPIGVDNSREPLSKAIGSMIMIGAREGPNHDRDWEGFKEKKVQPTGAGAKSGYKVIRLHEVQSLE